MLAILLTLIFIRPFISSLAFPYENLIYSELLLIVLIVWIIGKRVLLPQLPSIKYALLLFILAIVVSFIFSKDKLTSLKELYKHLTSILLFITIASLSPSEKNRLIPCLLTAGFLISLACIYQYAFGFQHLLKIITKQGTTNYFALDYISRRRPFFPFVTPNILAGYLAMIIPLSLSPKKRTWLILPLSFALLLTKSLGALLSIFFALIIYFYLEGNLKKIGLSFLAGLLMIIGFVFFARAAMPGQHIQPIFSTVMRLNYWRDTLKIIVAYPLTGVGLGNFNLAYSRYAHNSYLQIWAEMGILGMVSILWLGIAVLKSGWGAFKDSPNKTQITALIMANIVFLIHNLVDFTFFLPEVSLIWWAILGLTLGSVF